MPLSFQVVPGKIFTEGETVTYDKLNELGAPTIEVLDDDITFIVPDYSITTAKLADGVLSADTAGRAKMADGYLTAGKLNASQDWSGKTLTGNPAVTWTGVLNFNGATLTPPVGWQVQRVNGVDTAVTTVSATIPIDDTIPQNTEGTELTTLATAITPKSATNILEIEVAVPVAINTAGAIAAIALFQDSTAGALAATAFTNGTNDSQTTLHLRYRMVAGTTSATTFKVRLGTTSGSVFTNGLFAGTRVFGGVSAARMVIREIQA